MKKKFKKIISIIMVAAVIASVVVVGTVSSSASGTGVGLAEWALNAYYSNWSYVYGGSTPGAVDCSGLIYSYAGGYRVGDAQTFNSDYRGSMSGGIPNIHGLGLYQPGHVGVYVGDGMAVDARGDDYGVCYESVWSHGWTQYFKVPGVSYPDTGWVEFDGDYYYYEDGEYLADTTRTIDGETYVFASSGKSTSSPSSSGSSEGSSSSSSSSSSSDNEPESSSLKKGSTGSEVEKMQQRLYDLGYYTGAVDGNFGESTEEAFKLFQEAAGLYVDGVAGSDLDYLYADDAPAYKAEKEEEKEELTSEKEELADTGAQADTQEAAVKAEEPLVTMLFSNGDYSDDVAKIQDRLITLGYLNGNADGEYGTSTETAVMGFQSNNELEVTGIVEKTTYDKLFSDDAVAAPIAEAQTALQDADKPAMNAEVQPQSNLPKTNTEEKAATGSVNTPSKSNNAPDTKVEKDTTDLSSKGIEAVAASSPFKRGANATNFEFLIWLAIMIVVMLVTFTVVYIIEKKKQKATRGRRFQ